MNLAELHYTEGSKHAKKRLGRGTSSGTGKTAGRGQKGQKSRSGVGLRPGFEGGQTELFKRVPKRGFTNRNTVEYETINIEKLNCFEAGTVVTAELLHEKKLIDKKNSLVKILGKGTLEVGLTVKANKFSKSAEEAITKAGGTIEVI